MVVQASESAVSLLCSWNVSFHASDASDSDDYCLHQMEKEDDAKSNGAVYFVNERVA